MATRSKQQVRPPGPLLSRPAIIGDVIRTRPGPFAWKPVLIALMIVAAGFWIYWPALHGDWLWDDDYLIEQNELVHDPGGLWNAWFAPSNLIDYFPLTVSLEWFEWQLWPNDTFCYHLTNVILHVCSALLVWRLLDKLGLRLAWVGGLLFAVYPVMVESVAWMAELKNTLSMPPFLLALCAWIDFDRDRKPKDYFLALALFLAAMLCKTSMVMFPVMILLHAWWKRGRVGWRDLANSAPFFAISLAVGLTLIAFLRHGVGEDAIPLGGFLSRLACAGLSLSFYFSKSVLPMDLLPIYPQWNINPPSLVQFLPWPVLGFALGWLWTKRGSWGRHVLFGLGFFLLNLAPFVGFHTISFMRFTWVMDHFLYLPILGLLALAVAALGQAERHLGASGRPFLLAGIAVVAVVLAFGSHRYAKIYVNSVALWTYAIHHYPDAWPAHNDLGNALSDAGRLPEAEEQYKEALLLNPGYPEAHNNLGIVFAKTGRLSAAIDQFEQALKLCPDLASAQGNLAKVQALQNSMTAPK